MIIEMVQQKVEVKNKRTKILFCFIRCRGNQSRSKNQFPNKSDKLTDMSQTKQQQERTWYLQIISCITNCFFKREAVH